MPPLPLIVRYLPTQPYTETWQAMRAFTQQRTPATADELWLLQHFPVFTQGQAGKAEHILKDLKDIPLIQSDRGGQITYHGPGQLVGYVLIDIRRRHLNIRQLVEATEQSLINLLQSYTIAAYRRPQAPGLYVNNHKIAFIGLRIRNGCSYHGFSLNVAMDLTPFSAINPCGYSGLKITQIKDLKATIAIDQVAKDLVNYFITQFGYTQDIISG